MEQPVRRSRRQEQGDRSREEILDAATALMSSKGFSGTSISDIAKESGLPASSIYWHFESKSGVLAAVMERGAVRFFEQIGAVPKIVSPAPAARLTNYMEHSARAVDTHPQFLRLFMLLLLGSEGGPAQEAVVDRVRDEGRRHLHNCLLISYEPWGSDVATVVADDLVDLLLALFDGIFVAGQTRGFARRDVLVQQLVESIHALATALRDGRATAVGGGHSVA